MRASMNQIFWTYHADSVPQRPLYMPPILHPPTLTQGLSDIDHWYPYSSSPLQSIGPVIYAPAAGHKRWRCTGRLLIILLPRQPDSCCSLRFLHSAGCPILILAPFCCPFLLRPRPLVAVVQVDFSPACTPAICFASAPVRPTIRPRFPPHPSADFTFPVHLTTPGPPATVFAAAADHPPGSAAFSVHRWRFLCVVAPRLSSDRLLRSVSGQPRRPAVPVTCGFLRDSPVRSLHSLPVFHPRPV